MQYAQNCRLLLRYQLIQQNIRSCSKTKEALQSILLSLRFATKTLSHAQKKKRDGPGADLLAATRELAAAEALLARFTGFKLHGLILDEVKAMKKQIYEYLLDGVNQYTAWLKEVTPVLGRRALEVGRIWADQGARFQRVGRDITFDDVFEALKATPTPPVNLTFVPLHEAYAVASALGLRHSLIRHYSDTRHFQLLPLSRDPARLMGTMIVEFNAERAGLWEPAAYQQLNYAIRDAVDAIRPRPAADEAVENLVELYRTAGVLRAMCGMPQVRPTDETLLSLTTKHLPRLRTLFKAPDTSVPEHAFPSRALQNAVAAAREILEAAREYGELISFSQAPGERDRHSSPNDMLHRLLTDGVKAGAAAALSEGTSRGAAWTLLSLVAAHPLATHVGKLAAPVLPEYTSFNFAPAENAFVASMFIATQSLFRHICCQIIDAVQIEQSGANGFVFLPGKEFSKTRVEELMFVASPYLVPAGAAVPAASRFATEFVAFFEQQAFFLALLPKLFRLLFVRVVFGHLHQAIFACLCNAPRAHTLNAAGLRLLAADLRYLQGAIERARDVAPRAAELLAAPALPDGDQELARSFVAAIDRFASAEDASQLDLATRGIVDAVSDTARKKILFARSLSDLVAVLTGQGDGVLKKLVDGTCATLSAEDVTKIITNADFKDDPTTHRRAKAALKALQRKPHSDHTLRRKSHRSLSHMRRVSRGDD
eukprot:gnl/Chilomastix_cuspidata/3154.p1 GENE.gnl/Chilomastix_cuspidata/3154~~gnl/Chilomastix_cuspidata/3154.p1  ORF type:complete len:825 (-),score=367.45 gnl/Chilomastix_cuspidata/3154:781-2919(-)